MKDCHAILGVKRTASLEEITAAYRRRVKVVHPDRFSPEDQKEEWEQANRMLQELNEAFKQCKENHVDNEYEPDAEPSAKDKNDNDTNTQKQSSASSGQQRASYSPRGITTCQEKELNPGQIAFIKSLMQNSAASYFINTKLHILATAVLILSMCLYVYLMIAWASLSTVMLDNFIMGLLLIFALNLASTSSALYLHAYGKLKIKPCLIITPLYIIYVGINKISFSYLWEIESIRCYREKLTSLIEFKIASSKISWRDTISFDLGKLNAALSAFENVRFSQHDMNYWLNTNDVLRYVQTNANRSTYKHAILTSLMSLLLLVASGLTLASQFTIVPEKEISQRKIEQYASRQPDTIPPVPVQTISKSVAQTVTPPTQPRVAFPRNGFEWQMTKESGVAPLRIVVPSGANHYYIKIYDTNSGKPIKAIYIRPGSSAETSVPVGSYRLKYAYGAEWYGKNHLFGADTKIGIADKTLTFFSDGYQYHGHTIELILRKDGNLPTRSGDLSDF